MPVKLPFTRYNWSLRASSSVQDFLKEFVQEKKVKLEQHTATPPQDLITCLLSKRNEENERVATDKEILHNIMLVMVAGHDTSSVLASNMTHMDESIFPEPSKFDPARFENQESVPPYSFIAFGGGPHICPGNELARIETLVATHDLVTLYSWELCSDDHYIRDSCQYLL
ncbi:cytochrome P450 716B1-like [Syzygium oleosum]|uniref:cytochrome P450 716B1-like n=1 Tax=Syzygium oleosum TaxID=219896 RepID=UPI0024BA0D02|nr:cytochrome P450 716B1-like [Syzygium oleosum]